MWCENLLEVTEEESPLVSFAHSTIRDFITRADLPVQLGGFHVDLEEADHLAGEVCVTYLHFNDFKTMMVRRPRPLKVNPVAMAGTVLGQGPKLARLAIRVADFTFGPRKTETNPDLGALASYSSADAEGSLERLQQSHPFLKYAAKHWVSHTAKFQHGRSITWAVLHGIGGDIYFRSLSDNAEELGTEGRQLSWDLDDSSSGLKTVPMALWDGDKSCRESSRRTSATPFHFDDTQDCDIGDLRSELSCINEVVPESRRCDEESEPEAEWNSAVHGLLLRIVFGGKDGSVGNRCMWEAPPSPFPGKSVC
ncbi:hypothetical protein Purlil1_13675 [Purpureocillium lilacinum]|uniref:PD-(D/E)XK nuclease-like domain-containing protein n=1 Tax=Purpureocillium lilacinum TaxID=33203 RepID=A0ABR0BDQ1_PURLI|nr:hypothetical protein Purlil1_13675 [Purpureocillium lilacinum]